jgi:Zn-dependent metalloprotease
MKLHVWIVLVLWNISGSVWAAGSASPIPSQGGQNIQKDLVQQTSLAYLQLRGGVGGVAAADLNTVRAVFMDKRGNGHARIAQTYHGVPVFGGEVVVHVRADGAVKGHTDKLLRGVAMDITPKLTRTEALAIASESVALSSELATEAKADLQILKAGRGPKLAWRVRIVNMQSQPASMPVVFVNAKTGEVLWRYDNLQSAKNRKVYSLNNGTTIPGTLMRTEGQSLNSDSIINASYDILGSIWDCYNALFGRDSYDGLGAALISSVHYSTNYANGFWNGTQLVFGDGDGNIFGNFATSMDLAAHELTHAVTERTSNLIYSGESGALNESMSDIFGEVCEWHRDNNGDINALPSANNWMVAEDISLVSSAWRYLDDPSRDGSSVDYWNSTVGNLDVHYSSGISNLAFALLTKGGTHPRGKSTTVVTGIGIYDAAQIFYLANTAYLTPSSNFVDARAANMSAAEDLFGIGSKQAIEVGNAWTAVGVLPPPAYSIIDTKTGLSGVISSQLEFNYPTNGATAIKFVLSGGTGDADLYVRFGSAPTLVSYDCRPYTSGNNEICEFNPAQSGTYYVMINGYSSFSGVTLTVSADLPSPETSCANGIDDDTDGNTDCADSDCAADVACQIPPAPPWIAQSLDGFEAGWGSYVSGGVDAILSTNAIFATTGTSSILIRDNSGRSSSFITRTAMNLTAFNELLIDYSFYAVSMEAGENFFVEVWNGSAWQVVADRASGSFFVNNRYLADSVQVDLNTFSSKSSVKIRFRCDASNNDDRVFVDDIAISAR